MRIWAMPLISAMSLRGLTGRWMSAIIAVLVTRGSTTIRGAGDVCRACLRSRRWQRMGWLSAMLAPIRRITSAVSMIGIGPGGPSEPKESL